MEKDQPLRIPVIRLAVGLEMRLTGLLQSTLEYQLVHLKVSSPCLVLEMSLRAQIFQDSKFLLDS